jgi:hypothetical protein
VSRLGQITARLEAITRELGSDDLGDEEAAALTREAAELAAEAAEEVSRQVREAGRGEEDGPG